MTFHRELFFLLEQSAKRCAEEEGFDLENDLQLQKFQQTIEQRKASSLPEIIGDYQSLLNRQGPVQIECRWMNSFSEKEFSAVGLAHYFPKIYRGLPRLYHREDLGRSSIKKNFRNLVDLKRLTVDRAVFSLYEGKIPLCSRKIGILTHVLPDGWGDWVAGMEAASILAAKWPFLEIHLFAASSKELPCENLPFAVHQFPLEEPPKQLNEMDFLLQIPTLFPEKIRLMPNVEKIGEYGFLESQWFHPKSGNRSMGLHVLEKGIFIRKIGRGSFAEIEKKTLLQTLFKTETPSPLEIEAYRQKKHFHLAYLATPRGGAIYLHSLLKMHERDEKDIDLCCPDLRWLIRRLQEENHLLVQPFGVREIEVLFEGQVHRIPIGDLGKTVRILSPGLLSQADMRRLISLSEDWIAVRGNQSLSEVISAKKAFFYDGCNHARYFVKDLSALAENRLYEHRGALRAFRMMGQAFLWNLPEDVAEWVEESHFQREERLPWFEIATELGASLQEQDTLVGFKKICTLISEEHSFSPFLCHLLERELFHAENPLVREAEEQLVQLYATAQISFSTLVKNLRLRIVRNARCIQQEVGPL
ncbi:MAG TPA: hypothetical protein VHL30_03570 [Chlamydiales bacterium]|nr:hypothetical protein [Chlamydiales bacterium]